jgi:hypothetical protein
MFEFLTHSTRLKKRMAVWDDAIPPPLGENQKWVELRDVSPHLTSDGILTQIESFAESAAEMGEAGNSQIQNWPARKVDGVDCGKVVSLARSMYSGQ